MRFVPEADDHGNWGVADTNSPRRAMMPAVRYKTREAAEAFADVLNATDEGAPIATVEELRGDLDRVR